MSKGSGLGDNFYLHGYDVSGDLNTVSTAGGPAVLTVTGIDKAAFERIGGVRSGSFGWSAFFNPGTGRAHPRLSALPTSDVHCAYLRGTALGGQAACLVSKQINYDGTRADDGAFTFAVEAQSNGFGVEWGNLLTPGKRTDTAATNGPSVDFGVGSTTFGLQAYLQVHAFTGTDATVRLEQSSDNGVGDAWSAVTGGAFTAITTGPGAQRIQTARNQTVERYLRVVTATTGGFSNLQFTVVVARNDVEVAF